jgi:phosphoenolpyruvate carboxykinase (ATP)
VRVEIPEMATIIKGIARDTIEWTEDPYFGVKVPKKIEGVDISKFDLHKYYTEEQIRAYVEQIKKERKEWLSKFKGLNEDIVNAFN